MENLGQVVCNQFEQIQVSLREVRGEAYVELRIYDRSAYDDAHGLSEQEVIVLPVGLLPVFLRIQTQTQAEIVRRRLVYAPPAAEAASLDSGEPLTTRIEAPRSHLQSRRHRRVPLKLAVECRLLDPARIWDGKPVTGETIDVSAGGAQVWLPKRFPRYSQVELSTVIEGTIFRGRAEIMGVEPVSKKGHKGQHYRHGLQWLSLDAHAKTALSNVVPTV